MGRTLKSIWKELVENPWFTLLFSSKAVEMVVFGDYRMSVIFFALAFVSAVIWILSDAVSVDRGKIVGDGRG